MAHPILTTVNPKLVVNGVNRYHTDEVIALLRSNKNNHHIKLANGRQVNLTNALRTFAAYGVKCVECGVTARYVEELEIGIVNRSVLRFVIRKKGPKRVKYLSCDHVIPVFVGGADLVINFQPMCSTCNVKKGHTLTHDFVASFPVKAVRDFVKNNVPLETFKQFLNYFADMVAMRYMTGIENPGHLNEEEMLSLIDDLDSRFNFRINFDELKKVGKLIPKK